MNQQTYGNDNATRGNENLSPGCGRSAMESTSTGVSNQGFHEPLGRMVDSNRLQLDTIDLTTDQGEADDSIVGGQSDENDVHMKNQMNISTIAKNSSVPQHLKTVSLSNTNACALGNEGGNQRRDVAVASEDNLSLQHPELIDLISDDEETVSQGANNDSNDAQNIVQPSIQGRKRENDHAIAGGKFKEKSKLASKRARMR